MITGLKFIGQKRRYLISSSKDTLLKVWELETQHCVQTLVGHRSEVWSFDINQQHTRLVTGAATRTLRFYSIRMLGNSQPADEKEIQQDSIEVPHSMGVLLLPHIFSSQGICIEHIGDIERRSKERVIQLQYNPQGDMLACLASDKTIEFFHLYTGKDLKKRKKKRQAKDRKKKKIKVDADPTLEVDGE
jgi:U3 small nucleolar RNA-associated protein 12